ncbi:MAG: type II toxin-antitoxin system RelE/ParE family toxin [Gammaproteobacteria bacterium]|nr:MAG: type II toxin-antitoxin system RelE/ParE family toxin [Gammaproteobacteria bacterium]
MVVKWLKKALSNLNKQAEYIAQDNPQAAIIVVQRIKESVNLLKENPSLGRPGRIEGTRELVIDKTSYIVPYRVCNNRVEILRVFHTSRKPPKQW